MEEKNSSTTATATAGASSSSSVYILHCPCFLHEPLKTILKCLGLEISTSTQQNPAEEEEADDNDGEGDGDGDDNKVNQDSSSTTPLDPPSTAEDVDPPAITILVRGPPRRPIRGGSGGQIN